jgi:hypothetical protein
MVAKELTEELNKRELGYIWHDPKENSVGRHTKLKKVQ